MYASWVRTQELKTVTNELETIRTTLSTHSELKAQLAQVTSEKNRVNKELLRITSENTRLEAELQKVKNTETSSVTDPEQESDNPIQRAEPTMQVEHINYWTKDAKFRTLDVR